MGREVVGELILRSKLKSSNNKSIDYCTTCRNLVELSSMQFLSYDLGKRSAQYLAIYN